MAYNVSDGNRNITVGTDMTVISRAKDNNVSRRVLFTVTNVSSGGQKVFLSFGSDAQLNTGVWLAPGGYWRESRSANFEPTNAEITAISDIAGASLAILERIETVTR